MSITIGIVADTHLRGGRSLPVRCAEILAATDLVVHAGDHLTLAALRALEALGPPVWAVHGNVDEADLRALLPERRGVRAGRARIGLVRRCARAGSSVRSRQAASRLGCGPPAKRARLHPAGALHAASGSNGQPARSTRSQHVLAAQPDAPRSRASADPG